MSTRLAPLTRATTASMPPSVGATNTRLFTIWPSSAPTAAPAAAPGCGATQNMKI